MNISTFLNQFKDPYERKARVFPGLLVVLPLLVPLLWIFGPKNPVMTTLLGLVVSCGAVHALASIARGMGKRLEEKLVERWGGMPTTLILRHRDSFLDSLSKSRYHKDIRLKLGIILPTAEEELANPVAADDAYIGATRLLREMTRGKNHALLLKENIAYGFHRNMLAVRPIGVLSCFISFLVGLVLSGALQLNPLAVDMTKLATPDLAGGMTLAVATTLLLSWIYFNDRSVKLMGYVYAERLFESLQSLPTKRSKSSKEPPVA
ncbi:hypothetical protein [Propionivibrio dicarboxylicus]|uniref:Uncharacterized protein n=1 Tax=Propionivibrio dicarboxylicus TaxID=83767 RepID=A0A1G8EN71_9RHOO|nr:hypothetical protein [Propionivibrio dicarboxylicus]SDH71139.1 hypothetical protein SAMN05660652_02132 [Propionivibrio dicarboxylicus]